MSTKNVARNSDIVARSTDEHALRRARTRLLLGPVLNLLRTYRREVLAHLDKTISQVEQLDAWTDGGELPAELQLIGKLAERVYCRVNNDSDEERRLGKAIDGPVLLCEVAITELCRQAIGDHPRTLVDAATMIASGMRHSDPNNESSTFESDNWFETFEREMEACGVEVNWEGIVQVIDTARDEAKAKAAVGHA